MFDTKNIFPIACKRLELFRAMASNWDIEDDIPATQETIDIAHRFLLELNGIANQHEVELPEPHVYLLCDGQIEFEWDIGGKELDVSIAEENSLRN